jgi:hypothetical protein
MYVHFIILISTYCIRLTVFSLFIRVSLSLDFQQKIFIVIELYHILRDKYKNKPFPRIPHFHYFYLKISKRDAESKFKKSLKRESQKPGK